MKISRIVLTIAFLTSLLSSLFAHAQYSNKGMYSNQDTTPPEECRLTLSDQNTDDIVSHLLGTTSCTGAKGTTALGRYWVDVKQEDIDACYKAIGVAPYRPKSTSSGSKNWPGARPSMQVATKPLDIPLTYGNNQYLPDAEGLRQIARLANALQHPQFAGKRILIEGHANSTGTDAQNIDVTCSRAAKIRELLRVQYGVDASRLDVVGKGAKELIPNLASSDPRHRRVTIRVAGFN